MPETVWAIHNFEAEAEDEISFHIGEPVIIVQKDELYQDGWWEVSKSSLYFYFWLEGGGGGGVICPNCNCSIIGKGEVEHSSHSLV